MVRFMFPPCGTVHSRPGTVIAKQSEFDACQFVTRNGDVKMKIGRQTIIQQLCFVLVLTAPLVSAFNYGTPTGVQGLKAPLKMSLPLIARENKDLAMKPQMPLITLAPAQSRR
ncbi:MAG: hypothetical protein ACREEJ_06610 [Ensifer adhaerens]